MPAIASFELPDSHQVGELLVDDLHDLLARRQAPHDVLAERARLHAGDEVLDDLEVDVGFEQREADLAHRARDHLFVQLSAAPERAQSRVQLVAKGVEHRSDSVETRRFPPYTRDMAARKTVTVVFCDIVDSTPLGERIDPEVHRRIQERYFDAVRGALERHGGTVEKFIGDAAMAVFGIPTAHDDDALRAIRAAVDLGPALSELNETLDRDFGVTISIRTGVNTGEVVAGDPSEGQAFATGDAVVTAQRLESSARAGEILIGDSTYRLAANAVLVEPVEPLQLKGKSNLVAAWRLLGVVEGAEPFPRRLDTPLVGRRAELERLREELDKVIEERRCRLVDDRRACGDRQVAPRERAAARRRAST